MLLSWHFEFVSNRSLRSMLTRLWGILIIILFNQLVELFGINCRQSRVLSIFILFCINYCLCFIYFTIHFCRINYRIWTVTLILWALLFFSLYGRAWFRLGSSCIARCIFRLFSFSVGATACFFFDIIHVTKQVQILIDLFKCCWEVDHYLGFLPETATSYTTASSIALPWT